MRYSTIIFASFAAVALAQEEDGIVDNVVGGIEDIASNVGELPGEVTDLIGEFEDADVVELGTSAFGDVVDNLTEAADTLETAIDGEVTDSEDEAETTEVLTDSEGEEELAEGEEPEAASIAAIPVIGAAIAGVLAVVGML